MIERLIELVLDESKWPAASTLFAFATVGISARRRLRKGSERTVTILWAMNLCYGCTVGAMAFGHLLAVTIEASRGTLERPLFVLYAIGLALAVPSWWIALRVGRYVDDLPRWSRRLITLNACLGTILLLGGLHNAPLAAPAVLNIAYQTHVRRTVGWTIVTVTVAANVALLVGSLLFAASGQSFEQFRGLD